MVFLKCLEGVLRVSGGCFESVCRLSCKCLDGCLVSDWKVFGGCMKRVFGKIYLPRHFFGLQIFDTYGKGRLGSDSSGQFMSGHIRMDYSLPKIFGSEFCIQNIFGEQNSLRPKIVWTQSYFGINIFWTQFFLSSYSLAPKSSST